MIEKFNGKAPVVGDDVFIHSTAVVIGDVTLKKGSNVWCGAVLRGDLNSIEIGENSNIQDNVTLHMRSDNSVVIGNNVTVGHNAVIHGACIGNNCLIGMGAVVLDNVRIGDDCVIGAGALVREGSIIENGSLVVGNPHRVVRKISREQAEKIANNAVEYCKLAKKY